MMKTTSTTFATSSSSNAGERRGRGRFSKKHHRFSFSKSHQHHHHRGATKTSSDAKEKKIRVNRKEKRAVLPDSTVIDYVSEMDVKFLFDEISTDDLYMIDDTVNEPLTDDDAYVIVDVGANIGLFALEALKKKSKKNKKCELYAFEPAPRTYKSLQRNLERKYGDNPNVSLHLANEAVGDGTKDSISFTSFPNAAGWSTAIEDEKETLLNVVEYACALIIKHVPTFLRMKTFATYVLEKNLFFVKSVLIKSICFFVIKWLSRGKITETVPCVTLSNAVFNRSKGETKKINLLKIDVERYELEVLRGIREDDFLNIQTIVIEVHDKEDRTGVSDVVRLLKTKGKFSEVRVVQPRHLQGSSLYNVFASRDEEILGTC